MYDYNSYDQCPQRGPPGNRILPVQSDQVVYQQPNNFNQHNGYQSNNYLPHYQGPNNCEPNLNNYRANGLGNNPQANFYNNYNPQRTQNPSSDPNFRSRAPNEPNTDLLQLAFAYLKYGRFEKQRDKKLYNTSVSSSWEAR